MPSLLALEAKKLKRGRKESFKESVTKSSSQNEKWTFLNAKASIAFLKQRLNEGDLEFHGDALLKLWEICFYFQLNPIELEDKEDNLILHYGIASLEKQLKENKASVEVWGRWLALLKSNLKRVDKLYRERMSKSRKKPE